MKLLYLLVLLPTFTLAGGNHHETTNVTNIYPVSNTTYTLKQSQALSQAMGMTEVDWGRKTLQVSIGAAQHDGDEALAIAVGKKLNGILFKGAVGTDGDTRGVAGSITFQIK